MSLRTVWVTLEGATAVVAVDAKSAPATCRALAALLPFTTTAHGAKIAGHEFYLHLPLFLESEHARPVAALAPGTMAFWPERQLLCIYYGRIQEEDAAVTIVGRVVKNLAALAEAAEAMRRNLGRAVPTVRLSRGPGEEAAAGPALQATPRVGSDAARMMFDAYALIRDEMPPDVAGLMRRRGVLRPGGALIYAEGDSRNLHEVAWLLREEIRTSGVVPSFAGRILRQ